SGLPAWRARGILLTFRPGRCGQARRFTHRYSSILLLRVLRSTPMILRFSHARRALLRACAAATLLGASIGSPAQLPANVHLVVGFPPGGGTDAIARLLADALKGELAGTRVIVENKPGAG